MQRRSMRLSDTQWRLWVDSRGRISFPKALRVAHDLRPGDVLGWEATKSGKSLLVRNLSRELRELWVELEGLRGALPGSPEDQRLDELANMVASLVDHLYPVDRADTTAAFAHQAFALTQTKGQIRRKGVTDKVDAILACIETRRLIHKVMQ